MEEEKRLNEQHNMIKENIKLKEEHNKKEHEKIMKMYKETMKKNNIIHEENIKNLQVQYENKMKEIE